LKNQNTVTDRAVLSVLFLAEAEGLVCEGGYREVWEQVTEVLGVEAPWSHARALQLGRVGRRFEVLTGLPFTAVCPDLPAHTDTWVSELAA
jgi:hypothetical protein